MTLHNTRIIKLLLTVFLFFTSFNLLLPTFPLFIFSLGGSEGMVGVLTGLLPFGAVVFRPLFASLLGRYSRRQILLIAVSIMATAPWGYLFNESTWFLLLIRLYHSAGLGAFILASQLMLSDLAPVGKTGSVLGLYSIAVGGSMAFAPGLGLWLAAASGYGIVFISAAVVGAMAVVAAFVLEESPPHRRFATASAGFLLRHQEVLRACLGVLAGTTVFGAVAAFLQLQAEKAGIPNVGIYFTAYALAFLLGGSFSGRIADRYGVLAAVRPAFLLVATGTLILMRLTTEAQLIYAGLLIGIGVSALNFALLAQVVHAVPPEAQPKAVSLFNNFFDLGVATGSIGLGFVAAFSFQLLWLLLALLMLVGFFVHLPLKTIR